MKIKEVINETQKYYEEENIDVEKAIDQHKHFVSVLKEHNVEVIEVPTQSHLNEQVFTRDIGFALGEKLFVASMGSDIREDEIDVLKTELTNRDLEYEEIKAKSIEGGDVVLDRDIVWVGISTRTTMEAVEDLQAQLPSHKVIPLPLAERILHLDCAFNVISPDTALIYPDAFIKEDVEKIKEHYDLIEVGDTEQFTLGTNVLPIGDKKIISMPQNKKVNSEMKNLGFQILEVNFSEIIKSGGSFRCCSFPILRTK